MLLVSINYILKYKIQLTRNSEPIMIETLTAMIVVITARLIQFEQPLL